MYNKMRRKLWLAGTAGTAIILVVAGGVLLLGNGDTTRPPGVSMSSLGLSILQVETTDELRLLTEWRIGRLDAEVKECVAAAGQKYKPPPRRTSQDDSTPRQVAEEYGFGLVKPLEASVQASEDQLAQLPGEESQSVASPALVAAVRGCESSVRRASQERLQAALEPLQRAASEERLRASNSPNVVSAARLATDCMRQLFKQQIDPLELTSSDGDDIGGLRRKIVDALRAEWSAGGLDETAQAEFRAREKSIAVATFDCSNDLIRVQTEAIRERLTDFVGTYETELQNLARALSGSIE